MKTSPRRKFFSILGILVGILIVIQIIPVARNHNNPPGHAEPAWDSPKTQQLVHTACYDCHSNQTIWPWYSNVAPVSWGVYLDVVLGRNKFNFNEITAQQGTELVDKMVEQVQNNKMPPFQYLMIHPEARYSTQEKQDLMDGLLATYK